MDVLCCAAGARHGHQNTSNVMSQLLSGMSNGEQPVTNGVSTQASRGWLSPIFSQPWWDEEVPRLTGDWKYGEQALQGFALHAVEAEEKASDAAGASGGPPAVLRWRKTLASAKIVEGFLRPEDEWLIGTPSYVDSSEAYGTVRIRLHVGDDGDSVLFNHMLVGQENWSDNLLASKASPEDVEAIQAATERAGQATSRPSFARRLSESIFGGKKEMLEVVFSPHEKIGIDAYFEIGHEKSGLVQGVDDGHQAHRQGVLVGMVFVSVQGEPYTEERLNAAIAGNVPYKVIFAKASESAVPAVALTARPASPPLPPASPGRPQPLFDEELQAAVTVDRMPVSMPLSPSQIRKLTQPSLAQVPEATEMAPLPPTPAPPVPDLPEPPAPLSAAAAASNGVGRPRSPRRLKSRSPVRSEVDDDEHDFTFGATAALKLPKFGT